jgi:N-glycosylase/DNA lyase
MEKLPLGDAVSPPPWEELFGRHPFSERTLAETLIGGQAFRWFHEPESQSWLGTWDTHVVRLKLCEDGALAVQRLTPTPLEAIRSYLGIDRLDNLVAALPCYSDPVLAGLKNRWRGLSILRQPAGEALLAFICSSNKQILQIRTMLHNLAGQLGNPIQGTAFKALPTWEQLAMVEEDSLRGCALGYRARHVTGTAAFLKDHPGYLEGLHDMSPGEARSALQTLPGVGPKVADCVLLFGFGRMEAFPVDTWIARLITGHYPALADWKREQIATFAQLHFGQAAGLAQQWLFAERNKDSPISYEKYQLSSHVD